MVLFSLGKEEYGISITQVKEIIHYKSATKIPNTSEYLLGIISLRGKLIPVFELALRLGVAAKKENDRRVLVIETAGREIGLVVDEVAEVIRLQASDIEPPPAVSAREFIRGIGKAEDRLLILLNVDMLFAENELAELSKAG